MLGQKKFEPKDIELQLRSDRALLAAVINLAVSDATTAPLPSEDRRRRNPEERTAAQRRRWISTTRVPISRNAFTAMRFLFDKDSSGAAEYLTWLDIEPENYLNRLMDTMYDESVQSVRGFEPIKRRNFRMNYKMWLAIKRGGAPSFSEEDLEGEE